MKEKLTSKIANPKPGILSSPVLDSVFVSDGDALLGGSDEGEEAGVKLSRSISIFCFATVVFPVIVPSTSKKSLRYFSVPVVVSKT
jgi:hypothetical protein